MFLTLSDVYPASCISIAALLLNLWHLRPKSYSSWQRQSFETGDSRKDKSRAMTIGSRRKSASPGRVRDRVRVCCLSGRTASRVGPRASDSSRLAGFGAGASRNRRQVSRAGPSSTVSPGLEEREAERWPFGSRRKSASPVCVRDRRVRLACLSGRTAAWDSELWTRCDDKWQQEPPPCRASGLGPTAFAPRQFSLAGPSSTVSLGLEEARQSVY